MTVAAPWYRWSKTGPGFVADRAALAEWLRTGESWADGGGVRTFSSDYLAGPSVCGFWGLHEADFGDPKTPEPLETVVPSTFGGALLPFTCPHCQRVLREFSDARSRRRFHDARSKGRGAARVQRDNYWCPFCGWRFRLDLRGRPLDDALPAGAEVAPSCLVTADGGTKPQPLPHARPISLLGITLDPVGGCEILGAL